MGEPPACRADGDPDAQLVFRRGKLRKREDDEVRMMREALANLDDAARVKRILLELSRFYNPVTHGSVMGPETRRAIVERLDAADLSGARTLLEAHLAGYLKMDEPRALAPSELPRGTP